MAVQHTVAGTVVKERHPLAPLGLSLITLGIYGLFWYYTINKELRDTTGQGNPGVSLLAITLGAFVIVPPFVSWFNTAERIRVMQDRAGVPSPISPVLALVLAILPIVSLVAMPYLQSNLNSGWQRLARQPASLSGGPTALDAASPNLSARPATPDAGRA